MCKQHLKSLIRSTVSILQWDALPTVAEHHNMIQRVSTSREALKSSNARILYIARKTLLRAMKVSTKPGQFATRVKVMLGLIFPLWRTHRIYSLWLEICCWVMILTRSRWAITSSRLAKTFIILCKQILATGGSIRRRAKMIQEGERRSIAGPRIAS